MTRRTTEQRLAIHRAKAEELAKQLRIRTLRQSPAWKATFAAQDKIDEALLCLSGENLLGSEHSIALQAAAEALTEIKWKVFAQ